MEIQPERRKGRKGVGVGKEKRKNRCCCFSTNYYFSASSTQRKANQGCRGQDQELKAALLRIGAHCPTRGDPESSLAAGRPKPSLASSHLHFTAYPLGTSLDERRQSLASSSAHQQISDKTDFQGKILIY